MADSQVAGPGSVIVPLREWGPRRGGAQVAGSLRGERGCGTEPPGGVMEVRPWS